MLRFIRAVAYLMIVGPLLLSLSAAQQAQPSGTSSVDMPNMPTGSSQTYILITTIAGFASLLATHYFQMSREKRQREWDLQDRAQAREELRKHAETQRVETLQTAVELARISTINRQTLKKAIDDNTRITEEIGKRADEAYAAGNNFNAKLEDLQLQLIRLAQNGGKVGDSERSQKDA